MLWHTHAAVYAASWLYPRFMHMIIGVVVPGMHGYEKMGRLQSRAREPACMYEQ